MKNKEEKIIQIKSLTPETAIHSLLEELLVEMGLEQVTITHERGGKSEDGKDLICSYTNPIDGTQEWWAFVVKKGPIKGNSAIIQDIIAQVNECFTYPYENVIKGIRVYINKVKIVTNDHFSNEAERKIRLASNLPKANVDFWDADKLVSYIDDKYPQYWMRGSRMYKKYVETFLQNAQTDKLSTTLGINDKKIKKILDCIIEPKLLEREQNDDGSFKWKQKNINSIVRLEDNSIVIGEPGAGKSTLFKTLSKEIIEQNNLRHDVEFYPIIINFNFLRDANYDLGKAISLYFNMERYESLEIDAYKIIEQGNCVVFIDALDELPIVNDKKKALTSIHMFHKQYPNIKIICSSRPSDFLFENSEELGFKYYELSKLDNSQISYFINTYFADNIVKSKRLLKSLKDTDILNKMPQTPLTLALITILFDEKEVEIPATITDLYRQFVDLLIGKYTIDNTFELVAIGAKHRILAFIAKTMHCDHKQSIAIDDFKKILEMYAQERGQQWNADDFISDISENTGLLFVNAQGELQFKHLSFQEYFTAFEIFHYQQNEKSKFILNFNNIWWQNVAIFYAGMTKDAPTLLDDIIGASKPSCFGDYITNTIGLGKLLQALYNTPIINREQGVKRGLENMENAIRHTISDSKEKGLVHLLRSYSKFGLMQILGSVFATSYWSVTLTEPLHRLFESMFAHIKEDDRTENDQDYYEYKLFLTCSILASEDFNQFNEFKRLVEHSQSNSLSVFATYYTHYRKMLKFLSDEEKLNPDVVWIGKKLTKKHHLLGNIAPLVNTPIKELAVSPEDIQQTNKD